MSATKPRAAVRARLTGATYLGFILTSIAADAIAHIGLGDTAQVYGTLATNPGSFRLGLSVAFASTLLFLLAAWGLFGLLRGAGHDLALLFLLLNAVGVALQCASLLQLFTALLLTDGGAAADAAQAKLAIDTFRAGFVATQLFFGAWLFPLGYLVLRSGLLPRVLGILLLLDGVGELVWFTQALLLPGHHEITLPGTAVSLLAEVGLALWLLVMGVRTERRPAAVPASPVPAAR